MTLPSSWRPAPRPLLPALALCLGLSVGTGCAGALDRAVKRRTVPQLALARDLEVACAFGEVGVALSATVSGQRSEEALAVAWTMAGLCAELDAREAALQAQLRLVQLPVEARAAAATDARLQAARRHALAALRFQKGYEWTLAAYGGADDCKLPGDAEAGVYLLGLMAGLLAQVNDAEAGGAAGVPLNQILEVGRATACLDDSRWWAIPAAARFAGQATVPGSAPPGVDPWAGLADAAARGDAQGQGIPRALWLFAAANAGNDALVREILEGWPAVDPDQQAQWPLLDEYARVIARQEADLLWIAAQGHRAPAPPAPPAAAAAPGADPFGADPFGSAPFGADPLDAETPADPKDPSGGGAPAPPPAP